MKLTTIHRKIDEAHDDGLMKGFRIGLERAVELIPIESDTFVDEGAAHWNACRTEMVDAIKKEIKRWKNL